MQFERPAGSSSLASNLLFVNGFGSLAAFVVAAALILSGIRPAGAGLEDLSLPLVSLGWVSALVGGILGLGFLHAWLYLKGKPLPGWNRLSGLRAATVALVLGWPAALLGGRALAQAPDRLALVWLPLCLVLAVGLPVWWLLAFARRGLRTPSHRAWGTASVVLMAGMPLAILVELSFILMAGVLLVGMISNQPELLNSLSEMSRAVYSGDVDMERLVSLFEPFLRNPGVVFLLVSGLAVVVPLVEEALKPLGLWFLGQRGVSPVQGFALGAVSGAVFALVESLTALSAVSGADWVMLAVSRAGTALLHITCSALVGWGLGLAWTRARYAQLAGLFLLAAALHGTWNGFAQFLGLMPLINAPAAVQETTLNQVVIIAILGVLILASGLILAAVNRRLRIEQARDDAEAAASARAELEPVGPVTQSAFPAPGEDGPLPPVGEDEQGKSS